MNKAPAFQLFGLEISEFGPVKGPGVYAVCVRYLDLGNRRQCAEHVLYVGSSSDVLKRLMNPTHHYLMAYQHFNHPFVVYMRSVNTENYREVEKQAIRALRPAFNIQHKYTRG